MSTHNTDTDTVGRSLTWLDPTDDERAATAAYFDFQETVERLERELVGDGMTAERDPHWKYCLGCVLCNP